MAHKLKHYVQLSLHTTRELYHQLKRHPSDKKGKFVISASRSKFKKIEPRIRNMYAEYPDNSRLELLMYYFNYYKNTSTKYVPRFKIILPIFYRKRYIISAGNKKIKPGLKIIRKLRLRNSINYTIKWFLMYDKLHAIYIEPIHTLK